MKRLTKSSTNRVISGVCGGLGEYIGIDPTFIRIAVVLGLIFSGGLFFWVYLILSVVLPAAPYQAQQNPIEPQNNAKKVETSEFFGHEGFNFKDAVDVNAKTDDCGCNSPNFDNQASGNAHGKSNAEHDEAQFFKDSMNVRDGERK